MPDDAPIPSDHSNNELHNESVALDAAAVPLVLVADDNETYLKYIKRLVEAKGFECITTNSPTTTVQIAKEKHPSVILCDVNFGIGKMTGMEVFTEIRSKNIDAKFVLITAILQKETKDRAQKLGISDYMTKPVDPEQVIAILNKLVKQKRLNH